MSLTERVPGLAALRKRLDSLRSAEPDIDGHALMAAVEAAGPEGSSHRLIAIVSAYENMKGKLDPARWHQVPGLRDFVRETGEHIPMVPPAILARMRECLDTPVQARAFQPAWIADRRPVQPVVIEPGALMATAQRDRDQAEAFLRRTGSGEAAFFTRYAQWHTSLEIARTLDVRRVIDFGASSTEFASLLVRSLPDAEVCVIDEVHADGMKPVSDGIYKLGAPPFDLGLFEDESVDLVVAHSRFERLAGGTDSAALREVERVLVRGGRFVIVPFMVADHHALTISPFSCFIANGETDHAAAIEAEMDGEDALIEFNTAVLTPVSRRYDVASAVRRLLHAAPGMTARLRPLVFASKGFDEGGVFPEAFGGLSLRRAFLEDRPILALEFIKH